LRSPTLPPQDAWLSGYAISYYYFGYYQVALLARITGVAASIAYNLAQALVFAMASTGALGVVANLLHLSRQGRARETEGTHKAVTLRIWPALLGPALVLLAGNFFAPLEWIHDNGLLSQTQVPAIWYDFGTAGKPEPVRQLSDFQMPPRIEVGTINLWKWLDLKGLEDPTLRRPSQFQWGLAQWFFSSRVVHDQGLTGTETEAIDEMPAFSFLLGDLHPHVLALPFVFLALILALDWLLYAREAAINGPLSLWPGWERVLFSGVILGSLLFLNTWDFPIYAFIIVLAMLIGAGSVLGSALFKRPAPLLAWAGAVLGLSLLFYLPFFTTFQSQAGGFMPNLLYPTRFQQTVVMFGPVLVLASLLIAVLAIRNRKRIHWKAAWIGGLGILLGLGLFAGGFTLLAALTSEPVNLVDPAFYTLPLRETLSLLAQRRLVDSLTALYAAAVVGLCAGLIVGVIAPVRVRPGDAPTPAEMQDKPAPTGGHGAFLANPGLWMAVLMVLTGALLLIGPEFVYLRDNFGTRMNTLFKFYFQVWVLWGTASAFGLAYLLETARRPGWKIGLGLVSALTLLAGLIYLPAGLVSKTTAFSSAPTLDGMAYFAKDDADDWAAIQWLTQNVAGNPVILEGTRGAYWLEGRSSRISMATGLPTVMGWANHEGQWRGKDFGQVAGREGDIRTIYQSRDWAQTESLLNQYQVRYIIVSPLEKDWYRPAYTQKFDDHLKRVFKSGDVSIYER
ncbi:MAG TPA: DUF2298 domain-containing protein, partial [Anaerolineaceae bacterium]